MEFNFPVIAFVSNDRRDLRDDHWGSVVSRITLVEGFPVALLEGIESFSHVEVIFAFHAPQLTRDVPPTRHPRDNPQWPRLGLLAQRSAYHPNPIGVCQAKILQREGNILTVQGLDAIDGTPVLDLKPVFREFQAKEVGQPGWVSELMQDYWE